MWIAAFNDGRTMVIPTYQSPQPRICVAWVLQQMLGEFFRTQQISLALAVRSMCVLLADDTFVFHDMKATVDDTIIHWSIAKIVVDN